MKKIIKSLESFGLLALILMLSFFGINSKAMAAESTSHSSSGDRGGMISSGGGENGGRVSSTTSSDSRGAGDRTFTSSDRVVSGDNRGSLTDNGGMTSRENSGVINETRGESDGGIIGENGGVDENMSEGGSISEGSFDGVYDGDEVINADGTVTDLDAGTINNSL